jgi:hypothetical protein
MSHFKTTSLARHVRYGHCPSRKFVIVDGRQAEVIMSLKLLGICVALVCFAFVGGSVRADSVTVQNASFGTFNPLTSTGGCAAGCAYNVSGVPDWTSVGTAGSFQPGSGPTYFSAPLPDGNILAYVIDGSLSQDLGALLPDTTYTLTVEVGDRLDGQSGNFTIALNDGGTLECGDSGSSSSITAGTFAAETCSFTTGSDPVGDLIVALGNNNTNLQADFADVTVNAVSAPEPSSIALLGVGLMFSGIFAAYRRRKGLHSVS